jgi:hypothetical protein
MLPPLTLVLRWEGPADGLLTHGVEGDAAGDRGRRGNSLGQGEARRDGGSSSSMWPCEGKGERIFILGEKEPLAHYADAAAEIAGEVTVTFPPICGRRV